MERTRGDGQVAIGVPVCRIKLQSKPFFRAEIKYLWKLFYVQQMARNVSVEIYAKHRLCNIF